LIVKLNLCTRQRLDRRDRIKRASCRHGQIIPCRFLLMLLLYGGHSAVHSVVARISEDTHSRHLEVPVSSALSSRSALQPFGDLSDGEDVRRATSSGVTIGFCARE